MYALFNNQLFTKWSDNQNAISVNANYRTSKDNNKIIIIIIIIIIITTIIII